MLTGREHLGTNKLRKVFVTRQLTGIVCIFHLFQCCKTVPVEKCDFTPNAHVPDAD